MTQWYKYINLWKKIGINPHDLGVESSFLKVPQKHKEGAYEMIQQVKMLSAQICLPKFNFRTHIKVDRGTNSTGALWPLQVHAHTPYSGQN